MIALGEVEGRLSAPGEFQEGPRRAVKLAQVHVIDGQAQVQFLACGKMPDALMKDLRRFRKSALLLTENSQPQEGPVVRMIGKCPLVEPFRDPLGIGDRIVSGVVPVGEGHGQPGEKIGVEGIQFGVVLEPDRIDEAREIFVEMGPQRPSEGQDQLLGQGRVPGVVGDVLDALEPDVVGQVVARLKSS